MLRVRAETTKNRKERTVPYSKVTALLYQAYLTHTPRHLCLTDLARDNWDIHEIALFAGHRSIQTTLLYIHLSGRDLKEKMERGMASLHDARIKLLNQLAHEPTGNI